MASVRGASSIKKYEVLSDLSDKYTLECYKLNKKLQEWEEERLVYQKKYVKRFRHTIKTTHLDTDLPNFSRVYKNYLTSDLLSQENKKISIFVFYGVFNTETEKYADAIYLLELLKKFHAEILSDEERKYILNTKFHVELPNYFIEDLKNAKEKIKSYFIKQEEMQVLQNSLETLKEMRTQLDKVSSLLNENGLDISQPKETIQQELDICAQDIETFASKKNKSGR